MCIIGFFRTLAGWLMMFAVGLAVYDAGMSFYDKSTVKIRTVEEIGNAIDKVSYEQAKSFFQSFIDPQTWNFIAHVPMPAVIFLFGLLLYGIFRLLCLLTGRKAVEFTLRGRNLSKANRRSF